MNRILDQKSIAMKQLYAVILLLFGLLTSSASAADSLLYINKLPVTGTTNVSDYLTREQNVTLLENDQVTLKWQSDGNLVLYYCNAMPIWASNTANGGTILSFQSTDGAMVIKDASGDVKWSTPGTSAHAIKIRANRELVVLDTGGSVLWSSNTKSNVLPVDDILHTISTSDVPHSYSYVKTVLEYVIPSDCPYKYLYLRAEGGDGGMRRVEETWGDVRFKVAGGAGATAVGVFAIGTGPTMIPPGSSIRFSVGPKGATITDQTTAACVGGGGSGVMFRRPNDPYWHLLLVAGGGGGAYSDCCSVRREGRSALTSEDGGMGGGDEWTGGKNGNDGTADELNNNFGRGINILGWTDRTTVNGPKDYAVSGLPGLLPDDQNVGYGMGPGGISFLGGGGGGGFSGGGGGKNYYPGGGGGSFVNTDLAVTEFRKKNDPTTNTQDGFIEYQFGNNFFQPISMDKYPGSCITDPNAETSNGTFILLSVCNGSASQSWFTQGLTINPRGQLDKCLDLPNSDTYVGNGIQLNDCNGNKAQVWIHDGITRYIRSGLDMNKCFHAADGSSPNISNNRITLWDCNNVPNMRWAIDGATYPAVSTTKNRILYAANTKKCVDAYYGNTANGTNIQIYGCNNGAAQNWYFVNNEIQFNKDRSKCIDLSQFKTNNGNNIQLYDCNGTNAQKWTYNAIAKSFHSWVDPEKCIDLSNGNTNNGANIQIYDCNGSAAQQFDISN